MFSDEPRMISIQRLMSNSSRMLAYNSSNA
jgi:hypothetical protein